MKALSASNLRQYERATVALADYHQTLDMGVQIALRDYPPEALRQALTPGAALGAVIFGTDHGFVGQFNEQIAAFALSALEHERRDHTPCRVIVVGERVTPWLEHPAVSVEAVHAIPGSVAGITTVVQDCLIRFEAWRHAYQLNRLLLCYQTLNGGASRQPRALRLLPLDADWLDELAHRPWSSRCLPARLMPWDRLFGALIREYLFAALYRAAAQSLAAENATRLASMQHAEQNIEERLEDLYRAYHRQRQMAISDELLDIVAGVDALAGDAPI